MQKPQNIKGMRDHLPEAMRLRQYIINTLVAVFERHGFEPLTTPVLEYAEVLEGKLGDEEKLIYRFEDHGGRLLALRYDQTVPLARVVAQYAGQLPRPWRRYAVGPSYRGERPARGRYREFWQADVDIVFSSSPIADAEIIAVLSEGLAALGFSEFTTLLNHRQILGGIARVSGLSEEAAGDIYRAIDKLDKIGRDGVREEMLRGGVAPDAAERILALILLEGTPAEVFGELDRQLQGDERATAALENLRAITSHLEAMGVGPDRYRVSPRLARGLSYYTGAVFEAITPQWPQGSLLGGGRYDELIGMFAGQPVPTVGLAFGIDRLHDVMEQLGMGPQAPETPLVFVTLFDDAHVASGLHLAHDIRTAGGACITALEAGASLGKQFKEADRRGARYALVVGPDEHARGEVVVKDLSSGEQRTCSRETVVAEITS
jgi:histidyl-tRNA synthetase